MPEPAKIKTVALVDPLWAGHHPMYFGQFTASFLRAGARVIGLCPEPGEARREIGEAAAAIPDWSDRVSLHRLPTGQRSFFNDRFEGDPLRTWQRWQKAAAAIRLAEQDTGWHTDLVYFPYLDSYLRFLPVPAAPGLTIGRPWAGLYLRNHHHQQDGASPTHRARRMAKGDAILRSPSCRGIGVLDERFIPQMERYTGRPVTAYPDVTRNILPPIESPLASQIREQAAGRKIIGLIGLEKRKGTLNLLRVALRAAERRLPWYFVLAGVFGQEEFQGEEGRFIDDILARLRSGELDNLHFDPAAPRLPTEADFNSLFRTFNLAWAAFENFQGSSGTLSKAAAFEIPTLATAGECIGHRIERYRTGLTIPEGDSAAAIEAIRLIFDHKDHQGAPLVPDYATFRADHSTTKLDRILNDLIAAC